MASTFKKYDGTGVISVERLLTHDFDRTREGVFVRFEGNPKPTGFRGEGKSNVWHFVILFSPDEHDNYVALTDLFNEVNGQADGRIRVNMEDDVPDESPVETTPVVEIHQWSVSREAGGLIRLTFDAQEVEG